MPEVNPKVMAMVEEELRKDPKTSNKELKQKAEKIDKGIEKLDARAFNARYPLQVKRRLAPSRPRPAARAGRRRARAAAGPDRNAIRGVLLDFARAIAAAEGKADVVDVIGGVDRYVDRVVQAAGAA
ncbi:MAG TPA: hypothetical protein VF212_02025 [Longimicrobiales bacterium]